MIQVKVKLISGVLLFGILLFGQGQDEEKKDLQKFLDNIKESMQKIKEAQERERATRARSREEREKIKKKTKKQLLEKLSTPPVIQHPDSHKKIKISDRKYSSPTQQEPIKITQPPYGATISQVSSLINKIKKENPLLKPFKFPDLMQFLQKNNLKTSQLQNNTSYNTNQNIQQMAGSDPNSL
ncbi:MAG: hypothetical protein ACK4NF_07760, partial [Planctomycetota bacterium]